MVLKLACAAGEIVLRVRVVILAKRTPKKRGAFKAFPPHSPHDFVAPLSKLSSRERSTGYAGYLKRWSKFVGFFDNQP